MPFAWTNLVKLHPDVEAGTLTEAVFAIDLSAIAVGDPNVPVVNRDPETFFRATYLTADLQKLMEEVLASLAGKAGYNRVLKLRTRSAEASPTYHGVAWARPARLPSVDGGPPGYRDLRSTHALPLHFASAPPLAPKQSRLPALRLTFGTCIAAVP